MLGRIELILKTQNLTVSQFADKIGVQRSALSHVLAGRNNPSLDFVMKIMKTFPEIQSQWLLFGNGKMYDNSSVFSPEIIENQNVQKNIESVHESISVPVDTDLFSDHELCNKFNEEEENEQKILSKIIDREQTQLQDYPPESQYIQSDGQVQEQKKIHEPQSQQETQSPQQQLSYVQQRSLVNIILFYSDGHFKEYKPL